MDLAMLLLLSCAIILAINSAAGLACKLAISVGRNSNPDLDGHIFIECEISSCADIDMIVYEKTGIGTSEQWTPVYEGFNKTFYHALETGTNYTLEHRNDYTAFPTKHILNVQHLVINDNGGWRCVVIDENTLYVSNSVEVIIYVTPPEENIFILPNDPALVEEQTIDFVCLVDGIHPEPKVVWKVNGVEYSGGIASNTKHKDGLWSVNNTILLEFDRIGSNIVKCIMETDSLNPHVREHEVWIENHIDIDVKESARILYPHEDVNVTENDDSSFTLNCIGYGYKPNITWAKDGVNILDNNLTYTISQQCNSSFCVALLSPIQDPDMQCLDSHHSGIYTCIVSLEPPYQSAQISPEFKIYGLSGMCSPYHLAILIGSIFIGVVILGFIVVLLVYCWKRRKNLQKKRPERRASNYGQGSTEPMNTVFKHNHDVHLKFNTDDIRYTTTQKVTTYNSKSNDDTDIEFCNPCFDECQMTLRSCPSSVTYRDTYDVEGGISSIWSSEQTNRVYVGGRSKSSITVVDAEDGYTTSYYTSGIGTCIENGYAIDDTSHILHVYDITSEIVSILQKYAIYYIELDQAYSEAQPLLPKCVLDIKEDLVTSSIFLFDDHHIGVYCLDDNALRAPRVHVFSVQTIRSFPRVESAFVFDLEGLSVNGGCKNDSICVDAKGHICLSSWLNNSIYVHDSNGAFISEIGGRSNQSIIRAGPNDFNEPCHIQCFEDGSLVVVCKDNIYRYNSPNIWNIVRQLNDQTVTKAAFTRSQLVCVCADGNSNIQVYNLNSMVHRGNRTGLIFTNDVV